MDERLFLSIQLYLGRDKMHYCIAENGQNLLNIQVTAWGHVLTLAGIGGLIPPLQLCITRGAYLGQLVSD